ncbi:MULTISPECIES: ATP-binding protein [Serratia]|uniref:histidine kinase n=2 Tax=Bacteria TaxID=2 RepID=A0A515D4M0_SERLI|nr:MULTISPECIES: ATP-binding protein [Serratia]AYO40821.1 HAMP domain-containing protein [Serratia sp. P2ACOL2]MBF8106154.1 HAMP domain-containing protein [Serratia liquefaciens]MCS4317975.1 two-component system OmpR family sensor kinase [Serratia sp. BIGb0234]MDU4173641.1 ATP-binding protein [Serratia liquefaciens]MDU5486550.1 ATP-binding protein [Serratia liquefaciens]
MRGRLFWKILLGFWLTFIIMTQALWVAFSLYGDRYEPPENAMARRAVTLQLTSAATQLREGGLPALNAMLKDWSDDDRRLLSVTPMAQPPAAEEPVFEGRRRLKEVTAWVKDSGGTGYLLSYDMRALREEYSPNRRPHVFNIPMPMLWVGGLAGLLFSTVLAWNLTRPMRKLRDGFDRVAQGDLSVRLFPAMRRRHDELSEVARDFDSMAERLELLVSAREQLLHDVSHELRSPLARLQLAIGLARQNAGNVENSLQRIEHEAGRLDKMIGELLALSRAESNSLPDEEYFDLYGLVDAVVSDARYEAQIPGVEIVLQASSDVEYTVKGNAELMRRAVDNIVRNALRFSSHGQRVTVVLTRIDQLFQIEVSDQGPGVEESKLSSIFDPFVRVKSSMSGKGYGLGLAITRKVVLAHGGQVEARNGEQEGLVITLRIPRWQ